MAECLVCHTAAEVKRIVYQQRASAILSGHKLRDETAENLFLDLPSGCAMLVLAAQSFLDLIENQSIHRLIAPASRGDLIAAAQFLLQEQGRMQLQSPRYQRSSEDRDLIDRAKAILMARHNVSEAEAHRLLQRRSMDSGVKLVRAAQIILDEARER